MSLTVVLGAGFSIAASDGVFPATDDLGVRVMRRIRESGRSEDAVRPFRGRRFESWLSRLAEQQPDLSESENLRNREMFSLVTSAIREVIRECQDEVLKGQPSWWLQRLIGILHFRQANVVTFNYDVIPELVLKYCRLYDDLEHEAQAEDALKNMPLPPETPNRGLVFGLPAAKTFRLIKLHGSIDNYWVPGDLTGTTIRRWNDNGRFGAPGVPRVVERNQLLPGREPFIVPPAAAKSSYYRNPLTRQLWKDASDAIGSAANVALVGYSIPATDLVSSGMFEERLSNTGSIVTIVNPDIDGPKFAVQELGVSEDRIVSYRSCEEYVNALESEIRLTPDDLAKASTDESLDHSLVVGRWTYPEYVVVDGVPNGNLSEVLLKLVPQNQSIEGNARDCMTVANLLSRFPNFEHLRVEFPDGKSALVATAGICNSNAGDQRSILLKTTAMPSLLR